MSREIPTDARRNHFVLNFFAIVLAVAVLYFARIIFEPVAFMLFAMALVWPLQSALEARLPKPIALTLTILAALAVITIFALAIIWSIGEVGNWILENTARLQTLYTRCTEWLEGYGFVIMDIFKGVDATWLVGPVRAVANQLSYFVAFSIIVFLLIMFGLMEFDDFRAKIDSLDSRLHGWSISETSRQIAKKIRTYMLIRTLSSLVTGLAVFVFTFSMGLELAAAWGIISFVLNYIPYIGPLIAVAVPVAFSMVQFESWQAVVLLFGGLYLIQFLIGNYLEPLVAGATLEISPLILLCAFFFWDFLWGIPGAFIGLPVTIALFTICEQNPSTRWIAKLLATPRGKLGS